MNTRLLDPRSPEWNAEIDRLGALLRAGENPTLFPYHFLQVVLPRLGGTIALVEEDERTLGVGFLLPRGLNTAPGALPQRVYTLRYHSLRRAPDATLQHRLERQVAALLGDAKVVFYDPTAVHHYQQTGEPLGSINIGRPDAGEAAQIRKLHQQVWGSPPEFLYPTDLFSHEFAAPTALVARVVESEEQAVLAGFLFGFYRFDGPILPGDWDDRFNGALRLESQVMGVLPDYRGMRIGNLLKKVQAAHAWEQGIGVVHWTADPLQYPNAALNFGLLRALSVHFYPNLYPFRNDLNRVPASRFGLTWLVGSARVRDVPVTGTRSLVLDLAHHPEIHRVNDGLTTLAGEADGPYLAIEIPADWTGLQATSVALAQEWRGFTDQLFSRYVGSGPGQYAITGVATEGDRRFLIGQRAGDALWEHLAQTDEE